MPSPVFSTRIPAGNGTAHRFLRELRVPADRIARLTEAVTSAGSYEEALSAIERWFPVDRSRGR